MINKFRIGDTIVANEMNNTYLITQKKNDFVGEVVELLEPNKFNEDIRVKVINTKNGFNIGDLYVVDSKYFELAEPKDAKEEIKLIMDELENEKNLFLNAVKTYNVNSSILTERLSKALSESQTSDSSIIFTSAIKQAKAFVEKNKQVNGVLRRYTVNVQYIVNEEKRTVVALGRGIHSGIVRHKTVAKCDPKDVFDIHIGKAIALCRLMGVDDSYYTTLPNSKSEVKW